VPADAPAVSITSPGAAESNGVHVETWSPEKEVIRAELSRPTVVNLKLLVYPAWQASLNSKPLVPQQNEQTGQLMVLLPAGTSRTEITFGRTWDRSIGIVVSAVSSAALLMFWERLAVNCKGSRQPRAGEVAPAEAL
jgi:hypothetical protein